jgi:hypothetical protein
MNTRLLLGAAIVAAAVPAVIGLWGNASFSQQLPVRVPASGQIVPMTSSTHSATPTPSSSSDVDDRGGDTPRDQPTESGDDRRVQGATAPSDGGAPADDHGGSGSGADDLTGHDATDDRGGSGHGSDD